MSAACLEEGLPQGIVVRIASNSGVRENTLGQLRELVNILNDVVSRDILPVSLRDYEKRVYRTNIVLNSTRHTGYIYRNSNQNCTA